MGFLVKRKSSNVHVFVKTKLLLSAGTWYFKPGSNLAGDYTSYYIKSSEAFLSLFYAHSNLTLKDLLEDINYYLSEQIIDEEKTANDTNKIVIFGDIYDTIFLNTFGHAKQIIRLITKSNFLTLKRDPRSITTNSNIIATNMYLGSIYYKFIVLQNKFPDMKYETRYKPPPSLSLSNKIQVLYSKDNYRMIRALARIIIHSVEAVIEPNQSFYLEYKFIEDKKNPVSVAYSMCLLAYRDGIVSAINAYLLYIKADVHDILKFYKNIQMKEDLGDERFLLTFSYSLKIFTYKSVNSLWGLHDLFVVYVQTNDIARIVYDNGEQGIISNLQIIVPYSQVKKYGLHERRKFYKLKSIREVITQFISNGAVVCALHNENSFFIIVK